MKTESILLAEQYVQDNLNDCRGEFSEDELLFYANLKGFQHSLENNIS